MTKLEVVTELISNRVRQVIALAFHAGGMNPDNIDFGYVFQKTEGMPVLDNEGESVYTKIAEILLEEFGIVI